MKTFYRLIFAIILLTTSMSANAQSDFNFNVYGGSTNFWSSAFMQIPSNILSGIPYIFLDEENAIGGQLRYEFFNIKDDIGKIKIDKGNYFGFKATDLFSNIQYGLKFGWAPRMSFFGVYISCAYQYRQFRAEMRDMGSTKYKMSSIRPGIGMRITPLTRLLEDGKWSPIIELGTSYNYYFNVTAPFDNDKSQFNSGMVSTLAIGMRNLSWSITAGAEIDHYNLFNKDYSPDNGLTHPYADFKTHHITAFVAISCELSH